MYQEVIEFWFDEIDSKMWSTKASDFRQLDSNAIRQSALNRNGR